MVHNAFGIIVVSLLFVLLVVGCGRTPAATAPTTTPAPTLVVAVEPAATAEGEQAKARSTVLSAFTTADFSGPGTCTLCHQGRGERAPTGGGTGSRLEGRVKLWYNQPVDPWSPEIKYEEKVLWRTQIGVESGPPSRSGCPSWHQCEQEEG